MNQQLVSAIEGFAPKLLEELSRNIITWDRWIAEFDAVPSLVEEMGGVAEELDIESLPGRVIGELISLDYLIYRDYMELAQLFMSGLHLYNDDLTAVASDAVQRLNETSDPDVRDAILQEIGKIVYEAI